MDSSRLYGLPVISTGTASQPHPPANALSFTGIRAPLTIDDSDDLEYSSSLSNAENNSSIANSYTGSASEASISGDSGSEMYDSDPNEQTPFVNQFDYRPSVEYSEGESVEEKSNLDDSLTAPHVEYSGFRQGIPIALLSVDNDDDSEGSIVMEDDGFSSGSVGTPSYTVLERIGSAPKVRVPTVEGEEDNNELEYENADVVEAEGENAQEKQVVVDSVSNSNEKKLVSDYVDQEIVECTVPDSVLGEIVEYKDCDVEEIKVECGVTSKEPLLLRELEYSGMQLEEEIQSDARDLDIDSKPPIVFKWVIEEEPQELNLFGTDDMAIAKSNLQVGETASLTQLGKNEIQSSDGAENVQISAVQDELFPSSGTEVDTTQGLVEGDEELSRDPNISLPELQMNNNDDNCAFKSVEDVENSFSFFKDSDGEGCLDHLQNIDGEVVLVTDSDGEVDTIEENKGFETAALLKAAGLGSTLQPSGLVSQLKKGSNIFAIEHKAEGILSEAERSKLEKIQQLHLKFLHLINTLNQPPEDSIAAQLFNHLALARTEALQFEADGRNDLNFSLNVLVIGKTGVGKSATINSIFHQDKAATDAFKPATTTVKEMVGILEGVTVRVLDTPGLRSSIPEQMYNRKVLLSIKKAMIRCPPDVVLYVDRLDIQTRDLCDLPLLKSITRYLGPSIWEKTIVTLTHAASSPPDDGPTGKPVSYEMFVAQRLRAIQQLINHSVGVGDLHAGLMSPISLVENHSLCMRNGNGETLLPNGETWRSQLLLLCCSMKILSELSSVVKTREMCLPLTSFLSFALQSNVHPKCQAEDEDSDSKLAYFSNSDKNEYGYDSFSVEHQPCLIWGRSCKVAVMAEVNKKLSGRICIRTSSSDYTQIAILCIITVAKDIMRRIYSSSEKDSM